MNIHVYVLMTNYLIVEILNGNLSGIVDALTGARPMTSETKEGTTQVEQRDEIE